MEWIKTQDKLPENPGKESYEQIDCWVYLDGYVEHLMWNCEEECWDGDDGDDFHCEALKPTHWQKMVIPLPPLDIEE